MGLITNSDVDLLQATCSIQQPDPNQLDIGGAPTANYVPVAGLQNISCMLAPPSVLRVQATEQKTVEDVMALQFRHVLLSGYFPILQTQTDWQMVVAGVVYDILGAESDSQSQMTRVSVRIAGL